MRGRREPTKDFRNLVLDLDVVDGVVREVLRLPDLEVVDDDVGPDLAVLVWRSILQMTDAEGEVGVRQRGVDVDSVLVIELALVLHLQLATAPEGLEDLVDLLRVQVGVDDGRELGTTLHAELLRVRLLQAHHALVVLLDRAKEPRASHGCGLIPVLVQAPGWELNDEHLRVRGRVDSTLFDLVVGDAQLLLGLHFDLAGAGVWIVGIEKDGSLLVEGVELADLRERRGRDVGHGVLAELVKRGLVRLVDLLRRDLRSGSRDHVGELVVEVGEAGGTTTRGRVRGHCDSVDRRRTGLDRNLVCLHPSDSSLIRRCSDRDLVILQGLNPRLEVGATSDRLSDVSELELLRLDGVGRHDCQVAGLAWRDSEVTLPVVQGSHVGETLGSENSADLALGATSPNDCLDVGEVRVAARLEVVDALPDVRLHALRSISVFETSSPLLNHVDVVGGHVLGL